MERENVVRLYDKERRYQEKLFGNYEEDKSLNLASFLEFLRAYLDKANKSYTKRWVKDLPSWLKSCRESETQNLAPAETYDALIVIMTLAGAALESFAEIDVSQWRPEQEDVF